MFAVKLSHFVTDENNAIITNWPSSKTKNVTNICFAIKIAF
jgi:hypothetical protein